MLIVYIVSKVPLGKSLHFGIRFLGESNIFKDDLSIEIDLTILVYQYDLLRFSVSVMILLAFQASKLWGFPHQIFGGQPNRLLAKTVNAKTKNNELV